MADFTVCHILGMHPVLLMSQPALPAGQCGPKSDRHYTGLDFLASGCWSFLIHTLNFVRLSLAEAPEVQIFDEVR